MKYESFGYASASGSGPVTLIGGVPEHFNTPFIMAREQKLYPDDRVGFEEVKGGTGAMLQGLKDGTLQVCVALTECLVAEIEKGGDLVLLSPYVTSPLVWAITVAPGRDISIDDLEGKCFGVSRYGSGSHIMAYVLAHQRGWKNMPTFKVCNDFESLRASTRSGEIDVFLWEHFTTKPYVDRGEVSFIGGIPTPWPCFTMATTKEYARKNAHRLVDIIHGVRKACVDFKANKDNASIERVCREHHLTEDDAHKWMSGVAYDTDAKSISISRAMLESTRDHLVSAGVLPNSANHPDSARDVSSYIVPEITTLAA